MYLDIDEDVDTKTVKEYVLVLQHQKRLQTENSMSLKSYGLLNDNLYERFDRMIFCSLGV